MRRLRRCTLLRQRLGDAEAGTGCAEVGAGAAREESIMAMVTMDGRKVVRTCGLSCFSADERSDQESSHCK